MAEELNAALVRRVVEQIWNRGELELADALFTADYINHAGLITNLVRGPEAIKISVALYRSAFPQLQISIAALSARRDAVVLRWIAHDSPARPSHPASASQGALSGLIVSRCAGGQIAESWMHWDQPDALAQLGLAQRSS